ncbi:hypothetical protein N8I84_03170 [Streptomyces cynarae]|uniref:Uncharacterized protein n=1 Tax=Streptomyces cynarae TaxID=2981134 RepID=A0ABY6DU00_9ACTN|nr:hypothetical protein [Streptomyces cynarae]UXY17847.1 hypothetical protein N8I84_03170 [Streptomyces cynarae]
MRDVRTAPHRVEGVHGGGSEVHGERGHSPHHNDSTFPSSVGKRGAERQYRFGDLSTGHATGPSAAADTTDLD